MQVTAQEKTLKESLKKYFCGLLSAEFTCP